MELVDELLCEALVEVAMEEVSVLGSDEGGSVEEGSDEEVAGGTTQLQADEIIE
jgi:hypothetical protein